MTDDHHKLFVVDEERRPVSRGGEMKKSRDDGPIFLTTDEVADLLRTTRKAVYAMIERGFLPGLVRLGRRVLVRRQTLMAWLDSQERKTV